MMAEHSDDLDQLLDSALNEFENLNLSSSGQRNADTGRNKQENSTIETRVQGLGMSLPDLRTQKNGKQKGYSKESHVSVALDKLREQTMETVKGLESIAGSIPSGDSLGNDAMLEDWVKQFEELAGSQDFQYMAFPYRVQHGWGGDLRRAMFF